MGDYMERSRKQKLLMIFALIISIVSLSVGFAAFSVSLNISSSASVSPNSDTFSVKFSSNKDSLVTDAIEPYEKTANTTASNAVIDNGVNPTISNISVTFKAPGDYVVYEVYVRNEGEYLAYLNNINFIGNKTCIAETETTDSLVQNACESISIGVRLDDTTYTENTSFNNRTLSSKTGEVMYIVLEYLGDGPMVDGPFRISFPSVSLVYSTIDDSSIQPTLSQKKVCTYVDSEDDTGNAVGIMDLSDIVTCGTEKFYVMYSDDDTVTMLTKYNLYVGGQYIYGDGWAAYGSEATGIQDSSMLGFPLSETTRNGITAFSNSDYWSGTTSSYPSYVYNENSFLYGYVENYKTYLSTLGVTPSEARLITYDELENLGCSGDDYSCREAPDWVYSTTYWSGTASSSLTLWGVYSKGAFNQSYNFFTDKASFGCRPVIEMPLSEF